MRTIVITEPIPPGPRALLEKEYRVVEIDGSGERNRERLLTTLDAEDVVALVSMVTTRIDAEVLDRAGPNLAVVANVAVGYDNIDLEACAARGITATNTPGVLSEATADLAFALVLMATRRLAEAERWIRSGTPWVWGMNFMLGRGLAGKTLGVIGLGGIGQATARRATAFGMDIAYHSRNRADSAIEDDLGARYVALDELLATSDVVSLHAPHTEATHHLIGADQLAAMRPTAYLINTARGPLVNEAALVNALRTGQIAGAGLDVFENEPEVHSGLLELDNVTLLPHLGSATIETRTEMADLAVRNVLAVLGGKPAPHPIRD